jgi:hypothetical protein
MNRPANPPPSASFTSGWFPAWVAFLAILFLVPTLFLARQQWASRRDEERAWTLTLDPTQPDPGFPAPENVPTDAARKVAIGFYLESVDGLSLQDSEWSAVIDVWCRWRDDASPAGGAAFTPFDHLIAVSGRITDRKILERIDDGAAHYELQRLGVTYTRTFNTVNFPLDRHLLIASFENSDFTRQEMLFVPDVAASAVSGRARLPGYRILRDHAVEMAHSYQTSRGLPGVKADTRATFSQPRFAIVIDREGWGLFAKMFQAMFVAVAVALLACFIKPIHVDPRFGLGVGALFAAVANAYLVGAHMPEGNEFSLADVVNLLGIVTILVTLAESTISLHVYEALGRPAVSRRLDHLSFWTILACFLMALLVLLTAAASHA